VSDGAFRIDDPESPWAGRSLYELYRQAATPWEWHAPIFERAQGHGMEAFSSAFDGTAVDFLETLDPPAYKIASFELSDVELVARIARTGKPMIVSTGMADLGEIHDSVEAARLAGGGELILLCCTSAYPSTARDANLARIPVLRQAFACQVGLSDHSMGLAIPAVAVALGATVIEKHLTLRRADGGVDSAFSLEPAEFRALVTAARDAAAAIGQPRFGASAAERTSHSHRRSLYVVRDLEAGERLDRSCVRAIRPGLGLPVKCLDAVLGLELARPVRRGTPVSWDLFK
jgi:N-acetylneuraminate synthase